jgi:hypothetical protein
MRPISDRCLGEIITILERKEKEINAEKTQEQAEKHFKKTLEKLWPLKSNEKQS